MKNLSVLGLFAVLAACSGARRGASAVYDGEAPFKGYPIAGSPRLSYWMGYDLALAGPALSSYEETAFARELSRLTGVQVRYITPPSSRAVEAFNLMLVSGDMPDMVQNNWLAFPGGPQKAIDDGLILPLEALMEKHAPHLSAYLAEKPAIAKDIKTDSGHNYIFPFVRGQDSLLHSRGMMLRKDWLDELGLALPETIDDWTRVLTAFKEKKGARAPLVAEWRFLSPASTLKAGFFYGAYNAMFGFYAQDGVIKYGPAQPQFKEYAKLMRAWYKQGLLDPNFNTRSSDSMNAAMLVGEAGAMIGSAGAHMGQYLNAQKGRQSLYDLAGTRFPSLTKEGYSANGGSLPFEPSFGVAVSASSSQPVLAARFLDFGYSPEGSRLFNFGQEGRSYEIKEGRPVLTDMVMHNPDGLSYSQAMNFFNRNAGGGAFIQTDFSQRLQWPQQREFVERMAYRNKMDFLLPPISPAPEDTAQAGAIANELNTYADEAFMKYVLGVQDIDATIEAYYGQLNKLGLPRVLAIYQKAYGRYLQR